MEIRPSAIEYAHVTIKADVDLEMKVEVAFLPDLAVPSDSTLWLEQAWEGEVGKVRRIKVLIAHPTAVDPPFVAVTLPRGSYRTWVRLTDEPEVLISSAPDMLRVG